MKKALFILLSLAFAAGLFALISTSLHNFNGDAWNPGGEICEPCHTPHAALAVTDAPLWNHAATAEVFDQYLGYDMDADGGTVGEPAGISLLCLSCHDGVTALDAFGGAAGDAVNNSLTSHDTLTGSVFGTDLTN
ncbi:MAG: cytochrome C, partial [Candidatus Aminicenantes bacterium]|nr:cytochrome C [Candidatus Aminicenantes bacterium]